MLQAVSASIVPEEPQAGGREIADELLDALGASPDLVLLFVSGEHPTAPVVAGARSRLGAQVPLIGCSSFAEIGPDEAMTRSVTAVGLRSRTIRFEPALVRDASGDSYAAGRELGQSLAVAQPRVVLVFPDGLRVNNSQLARGLQEALGPEVTIVGGGAGDRGDFSGTFQISGDTVLSGGAVAVGLCGEVTAVTAAQSGWTPIGGTHTCTRVSSGNVLLELDGKPALSLYKAYLGDRARQMPTVAVEFPLGIVGGIPGLEPLPGEPVQLLRTVVGADEASQALVFTGEIPLGAQVRFTLATPEDVIAAAEAVTAQALGRMPEPSLALFFNCMARKLVLGARYRDELRQPLRRLRAVPRAGLYTYGELVPVRGSRRCATTRRACWRC
jgi:hypothetical protein